MDTSDLTDSVQVVEHLTCKWKVNLPDMYTQALTARGCRCTYQGKSRVHMIQLKCTMYRVIVYVPTQANSLLRLALKPIRSNSLDYYIGSLVKFDYGKQCCSYVCAY